MSLYIPRKELRVTYSNTPPQLWCRSMRLQTIRWSRKREAKKDKWQRYRKWHTSRQTELWQTSLKTFSVLKTLWEKKYSGEEKSIARQGAERERKRHDLMAQGRNWILCNASAHMGRREAGDCPLNFQKYPQPLKARGQETIGDRFIVLGPEDSG